MASKTPRDIAQKVNGGNGTKAPADIAKQLNDKMGKPLDIGRTRTPLEQSGNVLPPLKKGK